MARSGRRCKVAVVKRWHVSDFFLPSSLQAAAGTDARESAVESGVMDGVAEARGTGEFRSRVKCHGLPADLTWKQVEPTPNEETV